MSLFDRGGGVSIYYELSGPADAKDRMVLITGFAARAGTWDERVAWLNGQGVATLALDNRGAGETTWVASDKSLTAFDLAADVALLMDHVGWGEASVHVWGASMGGFVALTLAEMLIESHRLSSLYLHATCAGLYPFAVGIGEGTWKTILGVSGLVDKTREEVVKLLVDKSYSKEFLDADDTRARLEKDMLDNFERRFSWSIETLSRQSPVSATFQFSKERLLALRQSQVPIVVHVQDADEAMPTAKQRLLATNLAIEPTIFLGGHMEAEARERDRLSQTISNLLALGRSFAASQPAPKGFTPLQKKVLSAVWVPDAQRQNCPLCQVAFSTFTRRHHCRLCGEVVCDNCSTARRDLPFHQQKQLRVCNACAE